MVLRKRAPPHLYSLNQGHARSEPRTSISQISPTAKSASSLSPKRLTRPRRAQSSPQPHRLPSQESIYSPDLNTSPAFDLMPLEQAQRSPVRTSASEASNPWADDPVEGHSYQRPEYTSSGHPPVPNNISQNGVAEDGKPDRVPSILVAGTQRRMAANNEWQSSQGVDDALDWEHAGQSSAQLRSNNPFLRPKQPEQNPWEDRNSRANSEAPSLSHDGASARLGQDEGYIPMTARLSLFDQPVQESSPWAEEKSNSAAHQPVLQHNQYSVPDRGQQPNSEYGNQTASPFPVQAQHSYPQDSQYAYQPHQAQYQDHERLSADNGIHTPATMSTAATGSSHALIDLDDQPHLYQGTDTNRAAPSTHEPTFDGGQDFQAPMPYQKPETAPPLPDRSNVARPPTPPSSGAETSLEQEKRSETYSIRHVNWTDITGKLRDSPILVQSKNGPCPLLALVNALVLRASQDTKPPIVRALETREQISLGLLIEALFDELTTCLGPEDELPDIEALSRFLTMLHTGMNVNPRLTLESNDTVGTFLQTDDIRFYSTFGVPLVHGWVAEPSSEANAALSRVGQFHEDIQLLFFRKQDLEDRIFQGGSLTPEEEQAMKDIQVIQQFIDIENATQLSTFGLDRLVETLPLGSLSILFRNDHFSTLYKHPRSKQLFTLVTDAGYSGHAEIVWESLVDVNGSDCGFFAGDFRSVGHNSSSRASDPSGPRTSSNARNSSPPPSEQRDTPLSAQEQADADYAYALSLQYQEDEREGNTSNNRGPGPQQSSTPQYSPSASRGSVSRPQRSSAYMDGSSGPYTHSGQRSSQQSQQGRFSQPRPHTSRPANDESDDAPPTYEQAASSPVYPSPHRNSSFMNTSHHSQYQRNQQGRRQTVSAGPSSHGKDRNKDCVVM